jgi:hypothetical protein
MSVQHIFKQPGAPITVPTAAGHHYINTSNKDHYLSIGSATPSDWVKVLDGVTGKLNLKAIDTVFTPNGDLTSVNVQAALVELRDDTDAKLGSKVDSTRLINTIAPLIGGADLSADLNLEIPKADAATDGYLSQSDWLLFNSKQSFLKPVISVTADYNVLDTDYFIVSDATTNILITLPDPSVLDGLEIWIKRRQSGIVTVGTASGKIDGNSQAILSGPLLYDSIFLIAQGGEWHIG